MKKIISISLLSLLVISTICFGMDSYDSEFEKMEFAEQKKKEGAYGFQGCKNKKECGFDGYYLAKYSPEGLCKDCEFKEHSNRFVACLFCRMPTQKCYEEMTSFSCLMCSATIQKMLVKKLKKSNDWRQQQALSQGAFRAMENSHCSVARQYISALMNYSIRSKLFKDSEPSIYRGVVKKSNGTRLHVWVKDISIAEEDKKETSWEECGKYVESICDKYNVFGPETGEVILDKIPNQVSVTFEERIEKN